MACELYCCLLPRSEALRIRRSGFPIATLGLLHFKKRLKICLQHYLGVKRKGQPEALPEPKLDTPQIELNTPQIELDETSLAREYLEKYSQIKGGADKAFGINRDKGKYFTCGKRVIIDRDSNLRVGEKIYVGTPGLWELIVSKKTKIDEISQDDKDKYLDIINTTNAKFTTNKYAKEKIVAPNSSKYKIIQLEGEKKGRGVFLPSDPNALCERLELLMASKQAGNTSLRNEIVSICDELLRQKNLPHDAYIK